MRRRKIHVYSRCPLHVLAATRRRRAHRPDSIRHSDRQVLFKRMPFGVCNAPMLFQHMMSVTLGHRGPESGTLTYMDDIICLDSTFEAHLKCLEQMFSALQAAGLTLKVTKLQFGQKEIEYLGDVISEKGISISADRVQAILALPQPECIKDNRGFLGTLNYVRRCIDGYAEITAPLVELTRKDYVKKTAFKKAFGPAQREAFARAKRALSSAPVVKYPDFTREFIVHTDASEAGVGNFSRSTLTRKQLRFRS